MPHAAFRHHTAREGFEVVFIGDQRIEGHTAAVEYETPFAVRYAIELDDAWRTRRAEITGQPGTVVLEADGDGHWLVDGERRPDLDGCLDVDLESSAATNAFPVARGATDAPAAYVRAFGLEVMRLEQAYERVGERTYRYDCDTFDAHIELLYGDDGFVLEYPGLATRVL